MDTDSPQAGAPLHVLLVHQAFVGPGQPGGTRHRELAAACIDAGQQFTVVTSPVNYLTGEPIPRRDSGRIRILHAWTPAVHHRSFTWRVLAFLIFALTSFWRILTHRRINVVIATTPPIFQALSTVLAARFRRVPVIVEVRDLWPEFAIGMGVLRNRALIAVARLAERWLYSRATILLVNSPAYSTYLEAHGIHPSRIRFISNGADPELFDPSATGAQIRNRLHAEDKFLVVYAGAIGPANAVSTIVDAAKQLSALDDLLIVVVGDGKARPALQQAAAEVGNIRFVGARPKEEMGEWLAAADACVATLQDIPEFRTTYPNKVFDYMAAGRPTILAIGGVIRDVIENCNGGLVVPPEDPEALASAIRSLHGNRSTAREMGLRARAYLEAHFDRRQHAKTFADLMRLVATPSR